MRKALLVTLTMLSLGAAAGGWVIADAQPAQQPSAEAPPPRPGMHDRARGPHADAMRQLRGLALVYQQEDRNLTPPDVQKIAEAFLLWHGNHSWKIVDVAPSADGAIAFSIATPEGSVIARFTMDPHSARVTRVA